MESLDTSLSGLRLSALAALHLVTDGAGRLEIAVLEPSPEEARDGAWLRAAVSAAVGRAGTDGLVYAVVPPSSRGAVRDLLTAAGFTINAAFAEIPSSTVPRHLVPLARGPARHLLRRVIAERPRFCRVLAAALRLPYGERLLARMLPSVGLVARPAAGRPARDWPDATCVVTADGPAAVSATGWPPGTRAVVHAVADDGTPTAVVKVAFRAGEFRREAAALEALGPRARAAGAAVPEVISLLETDDRSLLVLQPVAGTSAAAYLARRPGRFADVLERIAPWLARWARATVARSMPFDEHRLRRHLLEPARALAPYLDNGTAYCDWLARRAAALGGGSFPTVAAHNDLTMWNVVLGDRPGIVDWEAATPDGLPLVDFFYAAVDAVAAAGRYADRVGAFRDCFTESGAATGLVRSLETRFGLPTYLPPETRTLCLHACWLHHGYNEAQRARPSDARPLLGIVRLLAETAEHAT